MINFVMVVMLIPHNLSYSKATTTYTLTQSGECTTNFDGTSAACPIASGTIALALEAK